MRERLRDLRFGGLEMTAVDELLHLCQRVGPRCGAEHRQQRHAADARHALRRVDGLENCASFTLHTPPCSLLCNMAPGEASIIYSCFYSSGRDYSDGTRGAMTMKCTQVQGSIYAVVASSLLAVVREPDATARVRHSAACRRGRAEEATARLSSGSRASRTRRRSCSIRGRSPSRTHACSSSILRCTTSRNSAGADGCRSQLLDRKTLATIRTRTCSTPRAASSNGRYFDALIRHVALESVPESQRTRYGLVVKRADLRTFPAPLRGIQLRGRSRHRSLPGKRACFPARPW